MTGMCLPAATAVVPAPSPMHTRSCQTQRTSERTGQQPIKGRTGDLQPSVLAADQAPMPGPRLLRPFVAGTACTSRFPFAKVALT